MNPGIRRALVLAIAASALAASFASLAGAVKDETTLVSRQSASDGGAAGDATSDNAAMSADGRYVAFDSDADNLSGADNNAVTNVFVRDTQTDAMTLVSRQSAGDGGAGGDGESTIPSISADGRYIAFASNADNLSGADNNGFTNVFVRDTQTNATTLVSRQSAGDGGAGADDLSGSPAISADGRHVAFSSQADNLSDADSGFANIYVRDTQTDATTLVSRQSAGDGGAGADFPANAPSISADGRYVAFDSSANNLSTADNNTYANVFVRDTQTSATTLISRQSAGDGGAGGDEDSGGASISADGRYVAFSSSADNLSGADNNAAVNVFVRDTQTNATTVVSLQDAADGGAGGDGLSAGPSISADGRYVAFHSLADNLSAADNNAFRNIFVRDTQANTTTLVSRQSAGDGGAGGDASSGDSPAISADGRYVAFDSEADNLSGADNNGVTNVFVRDVLGAPGGTPPPADTTPPATEASAKEKQKLGKPVKVAVSCDEACSVLAEGTAKPKGNAKRAKALKLNSASADLAAGQTTTLKLKPSKKTAKKLKAAAKAKATVTVTATDAAGNSASDTLKINLK